MARAKHCRIYIERPQQLLDFMWADVSADGTVVMGFRFPGTSEVELVLDKELGELRSPQVITTRVVGDLKLSFHATGQYKLTALMGKTRDSMDRATVVGPKLSDIDEPRRMAEILLPADLPAATKQITENDISLEVTTAPPGPLRCAISCMSRKKFEHIVAKGSKFVDTSIWECVHALETGEQVWSWVIRRSANETEYPKRLLVFLAGDVKWGQPQKSGTDLFNS
jgi:hypothetical protein